MPLGLHSNFLYYSVFVSNKMPRGGFAAREGRSTSQFIKDYLTEHEEAYIWEMWKALVEYFSPKPETRFKRYQLGSYDSFRRFIWILKKLELIELSWKEEGRFGKRYYKLVGENRDSIAWENPVDALYSKGS